MSQENVEIVRLIYASLTRGGDGVMDLVGSDLMVDFSRRRVDPFVVTLDLATGALNLRRESR